MWESLRPSEIRFIQDTIHNIFQDGRSVNTTAEDLCNGRISVKDFPVIKVVKLRNKYFSFDNRRLYVFRVAEYRGAVSRISVNVVDVSQFDKNRYTTENEGRTVTVRNGAQTLDHCKNEWLRQSNYDDRLTPAVTMPVYDPYREPTTRAVASLPPSIPASTKNKKRDVSCYFLQPAPPLFKTAQLV